MELKNISNKPLHGSVLFLSQEFGVNFPVFNRDEFWLQPGEVLRSKVSKAGPHLPAVVAEYIMKDDWSGARDYLKLVASDTPFDPRAFAMEDLPTPGTGAQRGIPSESEDAELILRATSGRHRRLRCSQSTRFTREKCRPWPT